MGLLDGLGEFVKTPEGQGLLSAAFGGMAGARRGQPWNTAGRAGMAGLLGYQQANENIQKQADTELTNKIRQSQIDMQARQIAEAEAEKQRRAQVMEAARGAIPEQDRPIFDVAPTDYIKTLPQFQKPQLVEVADPKDPLRTVKQWIKPGQTEGTVAGYGTLPEILDPRVQAAKKSIAMAGRSVSNSNTNVFNNTKDDFKNERDLRNDFAGLPTTKAFNEVQSAHDQIKTALTKPSPASDLAAATKIMKILDPGSVVRESELGMAMSATGALDRIQNYASMVMNGTKLTPAQRKDFGELSDRLYSAAADRYDASAQEYQGVAKDYGLNPDRVAKPSARSKPAAKQQTGAKFLGFE